MKKCALMLLMAAVCFATELTGKWTGSFDTVKPDGSTEAGPAFMDLKASGKVVTGTAGPDETQQMSISNGKLEGNKLTFEIARDDGPTIKFDLTFEGDSIKGMASGERDGQKMQAKLDLKRKP